MIDVTLQYLTQRLNQYLVTRAGLDGNIVVLNKLSNIDMSQPKENFNKVIVTLINLECERNKQFSGGLRPGIDQSNQVNPAIYLNLDILVSANFDNYSEGLKFLTWAIGFFQESRVLDHTNDPLMPSGLESLGLEFENSPSAKIENLWAAMGVSYLPSVMYKIRHVPVESEHNHDSPGVPT
ncbi:DUF4255 domain-containing protein [Pseudomonas sp.]|uniref:DUF4255 domain-containing protein n=1 Tax=Pseudomonas sp. TaxID=306 RepID=UPI002615BCCA|nr:DUF4255 domain-containing protein [Pseudomonas sp.]